jgi:peptidoglycan/LPS O-acetylase OafA/YrhL
MGMAAARTHPDLPGTSARGKQLPWGWLCIAALVAVVFARIWEEHSSMRAWKLAFTMDIVVGVWAACFLSWAARRLTEQRSQSGLRRSITLRILESRWTMILGSCSYSLYLLHALVLVMIAPLIARLPLQPTARLIVFIALGLGCSVTAAYLFHLVFERPFVRSRASKTAASNS